MTLRITFEDGTIRHVRLPDDHGKVELVTIKPSKPQTHFHSDDYTYKGLWITDTNIFVEVISAREAYVLNTQGNRGINIMINKDGVLFIDRIKSCKLMQKKIGAETFVKGTLIEWP